MNVQTKSEHAVWSVPVGEHVLGRVLNSFGEPIDGGKPLTEALHTQINPEPAVAKPSAASPQMLHTGIKVVDLVAPITRSGTVALVAGARVGKVVLMQELIQTTAQHGGHAVCVGLEERTYATNGFMLEMRSGGVHDKLAMVFVQRNDSDVDRERAVLVSLTIAEHFAEQGQDVLLFVDRQLTRAANQVAVRERLRSAASGSITMVLFHAADDEQAADENSALGLPDVEIVFSQALAKQGLYPAVDSLQSSSRMLDPQYVGEEPVVVAQQARDLLRRYADLHEAVEARGLEALADEERTVAVRARRLQRFLTQPFTVAEPWTGLPGEQVALADTIKGVGDIVAGRYDDVPEDAFHFVGAIEQVLQQATQQGTH